jgi:hypothetical protein
MKVLKYKKFLNEADTNQIPDTQLHKYFKYYKMWCDENGVEYNFKNKTEEEIIEIGMKFAKENGLPNILYHNNYGE